SGPVTVQRRVSSRGGIMVATQKIQVGLIHAGKIVTVTAEDHSFRLAVDGQAAGVVPRTTTSEIHRYKAYAARPRGRRGTAMPDARRHGTVRPMTPPGPLRGPKSTEGGGFAAAHLPARRACYGAAPPAPRVLRIALHATAPVGLPLTPE